MGYPTLSTAVDLPEDPVQEELGWPEVQKGLTSVLIGSLLSMASVLIAVGMIYLAVQDAHSSSHASKSSKEQGFTNAQTLSLILHGGVVVLFVAGLTSGGLILRGKWRCLMSAPERLGAKWLMFGSLLCLLMGPALGLIAGYAGVQESKRPREQQEKVGRVVSQKLNKYRNDLEERNIAGYMEFSGSLIGLGSTVFFILFMRSVARCFNSPFRTRLAEFSLGFQVLLALGGALLFFQPVILRRQPQLLLVLGLGALVSLVAFLGLLVSTITCINRGGHKPAATEEPAPPPAVPWYLQ